MKNKLIKKRNESLQKSANFIYERLEKANLQQEFDFWMWLGLTLNYWCVEHNVWLK